MPRAKAQAMNHDTDRTTPKTRPDSTLLAMIVSTGLLIAWAYSAAGKPQDVDLRSGVVPIIPALLSGE